MGCCTSLLYGTANASKNTVKAVLISAPSLGSVLHVACRNRRETICPACSAIYKRDATATTSGAGQALSAPAVANYIAKYATKTLTVPGVPDQRIRTASTFRDCDARPTTGG